MSNSSPNGSGSYLRRRSCSSIFSKADFARRENEKCKVWRRLLADVGQVQSNRSRAREDAPRGLSAALCESGALGVSRAIPRFFRINRAAIREMIFHMADFRIFIME